TEKDAAMIPTNPCTARLAAFALALTLAAGCHSLGPQQTASGPVPAPGAAPGAAPEPAPQLNNAQPADLKVALARSLEKDGDRDGAIAVYTEALGKDPTRADACCRLAVLLERQGRPAEAREWYRKALALQPDNADIYCNLGYSTYLQGDLVEASKYLRY